MGPLIRLRRAGAEATPATLWAKCDFLGAPSGSNKDRVAARMLAAHPPAAEHTTYVVPGSGSLGIAVAASVVPRGHRVVVVVPEKTSSDKIAVLKALGADIYRTSNRAAEGAEDSFVGLARRLAAQTPIAILLDEFSSELNPATHYDETAEEILEETSGHVDVVVVPAESCGTLVGVARKLKERVPSVQIVGVDARGSALTMPGRVGDTGQFRMEAIGSAFVPDVLARAPAGLVDRWAVITDREAFAAARRLIAEEGLLVGSSSGAAMVAALSEAAQLQESQTVVVLFNDSARSYTSTLLSDDWLLQHNLLPKATAGSDRYRGAAVAELNLPTPVSIGPQTTVAEALEIMHREDFDQLPVLHCKKLVGYVTLSELRAVVNRDNAKDIQTVDRTMHQFSRQGKLQIITPETPLAELDEFFERHPVAFVTDVQAQWCLGVVTKIDLVSYLQHRGGGGLVAQ